MSSPADDDDPAPPTGRLNSSNLIGDFGVAASAGAAGPGAASGAPGAAGARLSGDQPPPCP